MSVITGTNNLISWTGSRLEKMPSLGVGKLVIVVLNTTPYEYGKIVVGP